MTFQLHEIEALRDQPNVSGKVLGELLESLRVDDEELAAAVADICASLDFINQEDAIELLDYSIDEHPVVAASACRLLPLSFGQSPEHDQLVDKALVATLSNHEEIGVQQQAAMALSKLNTLTDEAVEALRVAAASEDARLSRLADRALEQARDDAA
ncbi:MAG: hypothetical protein AAGG44_03145 [Planctomycetota bacterium]